ncbi:cell division protein FtsL [Marinobacter sp.]|uniref:cell division protein FtsL n=1 Tax=Marinobacter sp. TaxID=50741 RepID=UPI0034A1AE5C
MGAVAIEPTVKNVGLNRQKVKDGLASAVRVSQQVFEALQQKRVMISMVLVVVLIASAVGVVAGSYENRELFNRLSQLHAERDMYQREWSQLLLEQSALSAHSRVEGLAAQRFGMLVPGQEDIVLVPLLAPIAGT